MQPASLRIRSFVVKLHNGDGLLCSFSQNAITLKLPLKIAVCLANLTKSLTSR